MAWFREIHLNHIKPVICRKMVRLSITNHLSWHCKRVSNSVPIFMASLIEDFCFILFSSQLQINNTPGAYVANRSHNHYAMEHINMFITKLSSSMLATPSSLTQLFFDLNSNSLSVIYRFVRPVRFYVEKDGEYWMCNCKQTKHRPFCDGTHKEQHIQDSIRK